MIEHIDETNVAWGSFECGGTFDIPLNGIEEFHQVGDSVFELTPTDNFDYVFAVLGEQKGHIFFCLKTEDGYVIEEVHRIDKDELREED